MTRNRPWEIFALLGVVAVWFLASHVAGAEFLTMVSDLISDSQPATPSNHTLRFTVTNAIAAQGSVSVRFDPGANGFPPDARELFRALAAHLGERGLLDPNLERTG